MKLLFILFLFSCSQSLDQTIIDANKELNERNFEKSLSLYSEFIQSTSNSELKKKAQFQKIKVLKNYMGDEIRAYKAFNDLLELDLNLKEKIYALENIANIEWEILKNIEACLNSFEKLEKMTKLTKYSEKRFECAMELNNAQYFDKLVDNYLEENNPFYDRAYFYRGLYYFNHQQWQKSIDLWLSKINSVKSSLKFKIIFYVANSYESLEDLDKAYYYYSLIKDNYEYPDIIERKLKQVRSRKDATKR